MFHFSQQSVHHIDAGVEIHLDCVEVAVVLFGDFRRDVAFADAVDISGGHVDGLDERVDQLVDADNQLGGITA